MQEIEDRNNRKLNIMIFKAPDTNNKDDDKKLIQNAFKDTGIDVKSYKFFRIGKYVANQTRPLKLKFKNHEHVILILKNKNNISKKISSSSIVTDDLTKIQSEYLKKIKNELEKRKENGEDDITIKYIRGRPTITKIDNQESKNSTETLPQETT